MDSNRGTDLVRLDAALLTMRRLTSAPSTRAVRTHDQTRVELSTMLVVDAISRSGPSRACSVGDVAEVLTVAHSTASRLVDRAVRAGMVRRAVTEGRRAVLELTPDGVRLQAAAIRFRTSRLADVTAGWSAADVATLTRLLERFAAAAHPHLSPPDGPERRHA